MTIKMIHAMRRASIPTSHFPRFSTSTPNKCWSTGKPCHIWQTEDDLEEPTPLRLDVHHHLLHRFLHLRLRLLGHHQPRQWLRLLRNKVGRHFSIFSFLCIWLVSTANMCVTAENVFSPKKDSATNVWNYCHWDLILCSWGFSRRREGEIQFQWWYWR